MRSLLIFLSLLAGMSIPALAHAATPPGSIGIRLLGTARTGTLAHAYVVNRVAPGSRIDRRVEITNNTGTPVAIAVYPAAAAFRRGRFAFASGHTRNELSRWTSVGRSIVRLAPGGRTVDTVTIAAPKHTAPGERYGVIWAELPGGGGSANVVNRVGVRIYLSVGSGTEPKTDFTIDALTAKRDTDGTPVVETNVTNTGGRAIDLSGSLQLTNGPGSLSAGPFQVQIGTTLAAGKTAPARVKLDRNLPNGPWNAVVTIKAGRLEHSAKATITFPSAAGAAAKPVKAESSVKKQRRVLIPIAVLGVLVVGGAGAFFHLNRQRAGLVTSNA
ncbi:MAG: hypothetical protein QOI47_1854 [Actinomycetota bacterium]|nr:hypothetical protein [Actinomycetota bacterium]